MNPDTAAFISSFHEEMRRGLAGEPSSIAMHPSFVGRPSGDETGSMVVLDLGGTNVRATVLELRGSGAIEVIDSDTLRLTTTTGTASDLFDPIAEFLAGALHDDKEYELGFVFAFPVEQKSILSGRLTKWTKEFAFSGVEGQDVVALLENALRRASSARPALRRLRIGALANDTVSALAAGAYFDSRCDIGLIAATGMNLAVSVPNHLIHKHISGRRDPRRHDSGEMIFNMECGNFFGIEPFQTKYDLQLNAESDTEGQLLEKMISGRYLGETVRLNTLGESAQGQSFVGWMDAYSAFRRPYAFTAEHLSDAIQDTSRDLRAVSMMLRKLGIRAPTAEDTLRLRRTCVDAARRSAHLIAMSIAATATYIDPNLEREHIVAADGSLLRGCHGYQAEIERGITEILDDRADRVRLAYIREGSGLGAAVVAATAERLAENSYIV